MPPVRQFYLGYRCLPTKFWLTIGAPNPFDMWETNTFGATVHARLNVALRHNPGERTWLTAGIVRFSNGAATRYILSQIPQHGGGLFVHSKQRAGEPKPDRSA